MTGEEVLKELERLFIITKVGEDYFITTKYQSLDEKIHFLESVSDKSGMDYDVILNAEAEKSEWPETVIRSEGRSRVIAVMDACQVPAISKKKYRLRGFCKDTITQVGKIVRNPDVKPIIFIEAVRRYYLNTEMPKSFKKLIIEGDAIDIYNEFEHLSKRGDIVIDPSEKPNRTWG